MIPTVHKIICKHAVRTFKIDPKNFFQSEQTHFLSLMAKGDPLAFIYAVRIAHIYNLIQSLDS